MSAFDPQRTFTKGSILPLDARVKLAADATPHRPDMTLSSSAVPWRHRGKYMEKLYSGPLANVLAFSTIVELATGLALLAMPAFVVTLLLAPVTSAMIVPVARVAGIALIALGLACWPSSHRAGDAAFRALLTYNLLVAAYLAYLGAAQHLGGLLLWPAVGLHAVVAGLLLYFRKAKAPTQ